MKPKRFLLQIPVPSFAYINIAFSLRRALMREEIDCHIQPAGLTPDAERALLETFTPDVILAFNGFKTDVCRDYPEIRFINWIQDNNFMGQDLNSAFRDYNENDLFYMVDDRQTRVMQVGPKVMLGKLKFAAEPVPLDSTMPTRESALSMIGYIPNAYLLNNVFQLPNGRQFTGMDYFQFYGAAMGSALEFPMEILDSLVNTFLNMYSCTFKDLPERSLSLLKEEYIRASNRYRMVKQVIQSGLSCHLFGPMEWKTWAELTHCYRGEAPTVKKTQKINQSYAINLHNGGIINHPRTFDTMAAHGGIVLSNRFSFIDQDNDFEAGIHYVEADLSDISEVAQYYLENKVAAQKISDEAYHLICAKHTWDHRVAEILADLRI